MLFATEKICAEEILEKLSVTKEQQKHLENETRDQSSSALWIRERQNRITGSKCGRILQQVEKTTALLQSTIYCKPFIHIPKAIQWGRDNEENACTEYVRYMQSHGHVGLHTQKAGFVVDDEKCWLGASPDAWVSDPSSDCASTGIAEFKCPYTKADKTSEEMCREKTFYLHLVNGTPCLNRDHLYYHQVQLQLYVTRHTAQWCDFCVYSMKGVTVERIWPDKVWQEKCLPKLDKYFFEHILPELIDPQRKPRYYL